MKYLGYVELGNEKQAYCVVLPDFDGCYAASDDFDGLDSAVQEAIEVHLEGEDFELPVPSKLVDLKDAARFDYEGVWMAFNLDSSKLSKRHKRINITVPEFALYTIDKAAKKAGKSRSEFLTESALKNSA